jgi:hypothetical protein
MAAHCHSAAMKPNWVHFGIAVREDELAGQMTYGRPIPQCRPLTYRFTLADLNQGWESS